MGDRLAFLDAKGAHDPVQPLAGEDAQQVVLAGQEELGHAGVALTAGAAAQLVVDAAAFVAFGAQHIEAAGGQGGLFLAGDLGFDLGLFLQGRLGGDLDAQAALFVAPAVDTHVHIAAQLDVGAAAGHVGGDGDRARYAGVGHDGGFLLMIAGVQHLVRDADPGFAVLFEPVLGQHRRQGFGLFDRNRADQDRLAAPMAVLDLKQDRLVLLAFGAIDLVVDIDPHHGAVGRDLAHLHLVDVGELLRLGGGGAGHARQLVVEPEIVLDRDRGQGLVLGLDIDLFLGLDGLVQALGQAAAAHHPAGELVDQDHLAALDDIVLVQGVEGVGPQGLVDVVHHRYIGRIVQAGGILGQMAAFLQQFFDLFGAVFGQDDLFLFLVVVEGVGVLDQFADHRVHGLVEFRAILGGAGDDQRGAGFVDQDRVDLVDDGEVVATLDHLVHRIDQVVAQIVEAELVVGAIGDVAVIGPLALALAQPIDDHAHAEAQEAIDLTHPFGVAAGQVVVDGDDVHALAGQGVQIDRQGAHQGLAFTGAHLGDAAAVQHHAADHLHVVMPLAQGPLGGFAHIGEGFRQDRIQALAAGDAGLEGLGLGPQLGVAQGRELWLQGVDRRHTGVHRLDLAVVGGAEKLFSEAEHAKEIRIKLAA